MAGHGGRCVDKGFFRSTDGIFKMAQFLGSLCVIICLSTTGFFVYYDTDPLAYVASAGAFSCGTLIISGIIYFLKLYNIVCCKNIPWRKLEMVYAVLCAILFFIGMCISISWATIWEKRKVPLAATAVFSAITMFLFILFAFIIFRGMKLRSEKESIAPVYV